MARIRIKYPVPGDTNFRDYKYCFYDDTGIMLTNEFIDDDDSAFRETRCGNPPLISFQKTYNGLVPIQNKKHIQGMILALHFVTDIQKFLDDKFTEKTGKLVKKRRLC